jgi:hypothetical protein
MSFVISSGRATTARTLARLLGTVGILSVSAIAVHAPGIWFDVGVRNLDFNAHYAWSVQFAEGLSSGDPYPHWMWRGNFGLGEAALLFYSPLFYYMCGAVRLFTTNTWEAMRIVFVLSTCLTGFYSWRLLRLFAENAQALAGAVLLQWAPMIFMLFYYFNGFPWAVGFTALVALCYYAVRPGAFEGWVDVPVSVSIAALVLTHLVSALMVLICFSFICLGFLARARRSWRVERRVISWFVSAGGGLALAMFYLYPALREIHQISSEVWTRDYTPWNAFAFPTVTFLAFGMRWPTFQWTIPVVMLLGVVAATWHASWRAASPNKLDEALIQMLIVSWASLFLASELSYPLWLIDTPLRLVQFPHRFIYVTSATGLVANLLALWNLQRSGETAVRRLLTTLPLVLGFVLTGLLSCKLVFVDGKPLHLSVDETKPYRGLSEYRLATQGEHWEDYYRVGGLMAECAEKKLVCRALEANSWMLAWEISGAQPARLRLPIFFFPAWGVTIDGKPVAAAADPATGLITVDLPAGAHRVTAHWTRLATERIGFVISCLAALMLVAIALVGRLRAAARPVH